MTISLEQKRKDYRLIYEFVYRTPRIQVRDVASLLGVDRNTASRRMREAFELGYVTKPQVRRKSFRNFAEYVYFLNEKNLYGTFYKYIDWEAHLIVSSLFREYADFNFSKEKSY